MSVELTVSLSDEQVALIARRAAEIIALNANAPDSDGWLRGAERIGAYIDAKVSRVYALSSAKRIPVEHDGAGLIARRSELDAWVRAGGGKRP